MDAANLSGGWAEVSASGTAMDRCGAPGLEFIPPMNAFCAVDQRKPDTLYYLRPTGGMKDPWVWSGEVFAGPTTAATWDNGNYAGPQNRARWSDALKGILIVKSHLALPELFRPSAITV
jgi:hypothetical protein